MNTQTHRIVSVLMVALMIAVVAAGWFLVAQPQLAAAAAANDQLASVQSQVATSQSNLETLRKGEEDLPELTAQLATLRQSIPSTLASSPLVGGIDSQAAAAHVFVKDITVGDPAAYAPPAPTSTPSASGSSAGATSTATPTPTPTPSASARAGAPAGKAQYTAKSDPLITASNFVTVPVSVTVVGSWDQTLAFVKNLQSGTRLYAVGTVGSKLSDDGTYETVVTGYIFSILDPAEQAAAAAKKAAAHPTPTPTAKPTKKPAPTASATPIPSGTPTPSGTPSR